MAQKNRKARKLRGSRTFGYGNAQKHRGAGSRGGRGAGGSKKQKWMWTSKNMPGHFGRSGFKRHPSISAKASFINVSDLDGLAGKLLEGGNAKKEKDVIQIDLPKLGVEKLLGSGIVTEKYAITVYQATTKAITKIESAGGKVTVLRGKDSKPEANAEDGGKQEVKPDEPGVSETDPEVSA